MSPVAVMHISCVFFLNICIYKNYTKCNNNSFYFYSAMKAFNLLFNHKNNFKYSSCFLNKYSEFYVHKRCRWYSLSSDLNYVICFRNKLMITYWSSCQLCRNSFVKDTHVADSDFEIELGKNVVLYVPRLEFQQFICIVLQLHCFSRR